MQSQPKSLTLVRAAAYAGLAAGIYLFLRYAPPMQAPDGTPLGEAFRIFYFHVPAAWTSGLALVLSFVASIACLARRSRGADAWAAAFTEVGWVLATVVILTGPLWAKAAWGKYWTWEPRLTSFLVLWLMYLGYLILRKAIDDPERRARFSAVLAIVAFLDVPLIFFSIKLWGSIGHPIPNYGFFQDPVIRMTIFSNAAAFLLFAGYLVWKRRLAEAA